MISRQGTTSKAQDLVYKHDILNRHKVGPLLILVKDCQVTEDFLMSQENIFFVLSDMGSDISSTKVRLAVRRGRSVRYIVHDDVIKYIKDHELYTA